jgi:hypothetical protein
MEVSGRPGVELIVVCDNFAVRHRTRYHRLGRATGRSS